jgi:translation initiation factor 1
MDEGFGYTSSFLELNNPLRREVAHIRLQKRNGRKSITTIVGLEQDLDFRRLLKAFKKNFKCIGSLDVADNNDVLAIKLSGDQRENVKEFLLQEEIILDEECIIIHG